MNKIYIIILNYNGWKDTIECLESVLKSEFSNFQIIVVDNKSTDHSMNYLLKWADDKTQPYIYYKQNEIITDDIGHNSIIFIQSCENKGFSAGNNIGINYALMRNDFEYIWLLNNDTIIKKETLTKLYNFALNNTNSLISSRLMYNKNIIQADGGKINQFLLTSSHINGNKKLIDDLDIHIKPDYLVGASLLISKDIIHKVGLLDENYFLYYEDLDYSLQCINKGFDLKVCIDAIVFHKEGASTKKIKRLDLIERYFKNRVKIAKKFNYSIFGVKFSLFLALCKRLLSFNFKEAKIIIKVLNEV